MNRCDWCAASLEDKVVYNLSTWVGGRHQVHVIGAECCVVAGRHADFANKHGRPRMWFEYAATLSNVRKLYASAALCTNPVYAAAALESADETCARLRKVDQMRARQPLRRSSRIAKRF